MEEKERYIEDNKKKAENVTNEFETKKNLLSLVSIFYLVQVHLHHPSSYSIYMHVV